MTLSGSQIREVWLTISLETKLSLEKKLETQCSLEKSLETQLSLEETFETIFPKLNLVSNQFIRNFWNYF